MVTLSQYPHYLYYFVLGESSQDENGTWQPSEGNWNYLCRCRIERNGQAQTITTADGKVFQFTATIYMARNINQKPLAIGTKIFVSKTEFEPSEINEPKIKQALTDGEILAYKENATFEVGRLHNRMWI